MRAQSAGWEVGVGLSFSTVFREGKSTWDLQALGDQKVFSAAVAARRSRHVPLSKEAHVGTK